MSNENLTTQQLHRIFLTGLDDMVLNYGDLTKKPLEVELKPPLPRKVRLYLYNATNPPGGRPLGEYKIQVRAPGQRQRERGSFDFSDGCFVILAGYVPDLNTFVFWDAELYPTFGYNRNFQVNASTVHSALAFEYSKQDRKLNNSKTKEVVLAARQEYLKELIEKRFDLTVDRWTGE